jgi:hypothetical protein
LIWDNRYLTVFIVVLSGMSQSNKNKNKGKESTKTRLKKDPQTGRMVVSGPSFTKEDIARDFPVDCCRDAIILRRSVGLGKNDLFEGNTEFNIDDKEEVAKNFPRECCRFARSIRRLVGLTGDGLVGSLDKCCFAD